MLRRADPSAPQVTRGKCQHDEISNDSYSNFSEGLTPDVNPKDTGSVSVTLLITHPFENFEESNHDAADHSSKNVNPPS